MVKKIYKWKPIVQDYEEDLRADGMTMLNKTSVKRRLRIGQSASRTVVNGEMSLRRLKLSIYEGVTPRGGGGGGEEEEEEGEEEEEEEALNCGREKEWISQKEKYDLPCASTWHAYNITYIVLQRLNDLL
jgi:hypothetical protein